MDHILHRSLYRCRSYCFLIASLFLLVGGWSSGGASVNSTPPPDSVKPTSSKTLSFNEKRWQDAKVRPEWRLKVDKAIDKYRLTKGRYETIERQRKGGVPARIVFVLHGRESTWNFSKHLHEGSPLSGRTRWVPKGRIPGKNPPYTFEQSAEDALYVIKSMHTVNWNSIEDTLSAIEKYNGTGYLRFHKNVNSPYLFSGTTLYTRGKYVADGKFSATAVDAQIGCVTILKRMEELGVR